MPQSNHERVGKALELLRVGLHPFVARELQATYGEHWGQTVAANLCEHQAAGLRDGGAGHLDVQVLLTILWDQWNAAFKNVLGHAERNLVSELREVRNKWAHQEAFNSDDTYRALDSMQRLLMAISAAREAEEIERQKQEVLCIRFEEQTRKEIRKVAVIAIEGQPTGGLRPWREIVTPHPDVASGRYQQSEFAADLSQVYRGVGASEYCDPRDFFQRTFLTEGLRHLLTTAIQRLAGTGGDPVIELQTNFGGGKTHSMIALYHLFSGVPASDLAGIEAILGTQASRLPQVQRAVLVGFEYSPAQPRTKPDGTVIRTLWGELAWQLLGRDGYALVAADDQQGVSPGAATLRELFTAAHPCLILIDEWVTYVRQTYGISGLPGGSFDANMTFAQALTEAAKASPQTLVVASIPASDIETGGEGGREALTRLKHIFGRVESTWRPASAEEGYEIVRRRLFQPITDPARFAARDAVARAFVNYYRSQAQEFPSGCGEGSYEQRIKAAYPVHPELFDRLYNDWSSIDKFQRTRGVLRLMAAVIHALWERQDASLLILPASVPIDDPAVQYELTRHLEDHWAPIIEKDVDGPYSLPLQLDRDYPNLGRYSASRRVARTIYLGSAPTLNAANKGLDDRHIKLGCAQPGESVATFGDALHRLTDQATYLYLDGQRYWYSTQPSVTRLAQDRAAQLNEDDVLAEIERRLRRLHTEQSTRGDFARVHACPASASDIPDERETRLVILRPCYPHAARDQNSPARAEAAAILDQRGTGPRRYRNMLVFLAADRPRLDELKQAARQFLAWKSIEAERDILNLDAFQANQVRTKRESADEAVQQRIPETYIWLLVPPNPQEMAEWKEFRLQGQDALAVRAARKLKNDGLLITQLAGTLLRDELDRIPLWRGDDVSLRQLVEDFAQYRYLPRLKNPEEVLMAAVREGVAMLTWEHETFAYADSWDAERQRYRGLRAGQHVAVTLDGLLVRPEAAQRQFAAEATTPAVPAGVVTALSASPPGPNSAGLSVAERGTGGVLSMEGPSPGATLPATATPPRRFYGSVSLDPLRMGRDAGQIAEEVVQHLSALLGAHVEITLKIRAEIPDGVPESTVRTVQENCRTLRFTSCEFEER
jgi:predicted AAA+ superfamily ATPase